MLAQIWGLIRARWPLLVAAGVVIFIPVGLLEALDESLQEFVTEAELNAIALIEVVTAAFLLGAGALLGDVLYAGIVAAVVVAEREGRDRRLRDVLGHLPVLRLVGADLLLGLVVAVGLVLLVVPAFVWLTWFALIAPVIEVERPSVRAAFRRSRELVRGHFWLVFCLVIPIILGSEILSTFILSGAVWAIGDGFFGDWAGGVLSNVLTAPLFALAVVVLYFELREPGDAESR